MAQPVGGFAGKSALGMIARPARAPTGTTARTVSPGQETTGPHPPGRQCTPIASAATASARSGPKPAIHQACIHLADAGWAPTVIRHGQGTEFGRVRYHRPPPPSPPPPGQAQEPQLAEGGVGRWCCSISRMRGAGGVSIQRRRSGSWDANRALACGNGPGSDWGSARRSEAGYDHRGGGCHGKQELAGRGASAARRSAGISSRNGDATSSLAASSPARATIARLPARLQAWGCRRKDRPSGHPHLANAAANAEPGREAAPPPSRANRSFQRGQRTNPLGVRLSGDSPAGPRAARVQELTRPKKHHHPAGGQGP